MKKSRARKLKDIASDMPLSYETTYESMFISGDDLNLTKIGESPFDPNFRYTFECPVFTINNNYRRLKRANH